MAPTYKIAVIQLHPEPLQIESNFSRAANFIRSAALQGAHLAVLPEYHLTSWVPQEPGFIELTAQWTHYLQKYQALAKECNICIVPGTVLEKHIDEEQEKGKEENYQLLNVAYFIGNQGDVLGKYVKKNLWHTERPHLTSSGHHPHEVFQTPVGPVGLLICWDLAFPEAFRELVAGGAKIIIIPTFWTLNDCTPAGLSRNPVSEAVFLDSTLISRTFENTCAIVFANAGGPAGKGFAGLSQITVPFIGPLVRLGSSEEGMAVVDVDTTVLEEAEEAYKIRADLVRDDWPYVYRHDAGQGLKGGHGRET
ncbi:MAG: hypothetical protein M1819_006456 [Sarea resinae]|nr:MAG: hypothetical protein M1819_006456 [Sarea resinae]